MSPSPDDFDQPLPPPRSPQGRDRGLRRTRRLTRWIAVSAVAGAAALGGLYTHLLPGSSAAPAPTGPPVPGHTASSSAPAGEDDPGHGQVGAGHEDDEGEHEGTTPAAPPTPSAPPPPPTATRQQPHATTGAS
ncbi:hypothetical protein [Streptomyces sp. NPDC001500]